MADLKPRREWQPWKTVLANAVFVCLALGGLYLAGLAGGAAPEQSSEVSYSEVEQALAAGKVERVVVTDQQIIAYLKSHDQKGAAMVLRAERIEPELAEQLARYQVPFSREHSSNLLSQIMAWVMPLLFFFGVWYLITRGGAQRGMPGMMSVGKNRAKVLLEKRTGVTFADVAGVDEAKEELREVVDFLKEPARYSRLGARIPKGVLLVGPPGTGKTLLARALAGEASVTFLSTNGAEFVEMFVGVGAARVRDLFEQARLSAPAIIFIDELDALGRARGAYGPGGHDEKEQTLNQLLAEMDGFDPSVGVIIIGATNRPEILDPALLRAGRFDRQVLVDRPDLKGRLAVLGVHARKVKLAPDVDLERVAAMTPGFAGADLANLINEAALLATRRNAEAVALADIMAALERIVGGLEKKTRILNAHERETVAYHEMGHALVAMALPGMDPVQKVSIIPRGISALGYTIQRPTEDRFLMSKDELQRRMAVLLGGRAAELLVFGTPSTGAADDLAKATELARAIVTRYGMSEQLGLAAYETEPHAFLQGTSLAPAERDYSEQTAREIDCAVREMVLAAFQTATSVLTKARTVLEKGAKLVLEKESIGESELAQLRLALRETDAQPAARESVRAA
ncbi:MAG TPA: ATP-dependent zinc metalloprotease FtsH [Steroidobacteraceae bacterium]|nr:ATP-dependent zinc metalloprotease FtsH [Steroidobacteraceae bacterium]